MTMLAVILLALQLGGGFGEANAEVLTIDGQSMVVDIQVEILESAEAVVAHLAFDDDPQISLPLLDRGGGVFGITTELPLKNYAVVFELIPDGLISPAALLSDLGADFGSNDVPTPTTEPPEEEGLSPETRRLGWLALALAAASLSALAFWVIIGRRDEEDSSQEEE